MAFTPPVFNLLADVWFCGNTPNDGDPDFEDQACQLYLPSRVVVASRPTENQYFVSAIQIRLPIDSLVNWQSAFIYEVPAESGRYFLAAFKEKQHLGFVNQYLLTAVFQCDGDGQPILRDVCPSISPGFHNVNGVGVVGAFVEPSGFVNNNGDETFHETHGTGEITVEITSDGEATNHQTVHHVSGAGDITVDITGEGTAHNLG